jgi:hypothetical protein
MVIPPLVHAEHRIARRLGDAGACSPETAQPIVPKRLIEHRALGRLVSAGAVRDAGGQHYYFDLAAYHAHRSRGRKRALIAVAVMLFIVLTLALSGVIPVSPTPP